MRRSFMLLAFLALAASLSAQTLTPRIRFASGSPVNCTGVGSPHIACLSTGERLIIWEIFNPETGATLATGTEHMLAIATPSSRRGERDFMQARLDEYLDVNGFTEPSGSGQLPSSTGAVASVFGRIGAVVKAADDYAVADITGLQTALNGKQAALGFTPENSASKAAASGYASLDAGTKIPIAQIPTGATGTTVPFGNDARFSDARTALGHNILSAQHGDTTAASLVRGDGLFAVGVTPTLQRVARSAATGGYWKWNGTDVVASTGAASGTGTPTACTSGAVTAFALNADAAPTSTCTPITSALVDAATIPRQPAAGGTKALATTAIAANTCSAAQTLTVTGTATSSVVLWDFATTPIGVTGYGTAGLVVVTFATANTANIVVCNRTAASITPGAMTLNVRVVL